MVYVNAFWAAALGASMLISDTFTPDPAQLDKDKPLEAAAAAFLSSRVVVYELHQLAKSRLATTKGQLTYLKRPHQDIVIARCMLSVPRGDLVEVVALPEAHNPFAAVGETQAFDTIEAIAKETYGPEILKHLHRYSSLTFKLSPRMTPLENEVLAYLAGF